MSRTDSPRGPILYVFGRFPLLSETFVANEVADLRALGMPIVSVATGRRPSSDAPMHDRGRELEKRTTYPPASAMRLAWFCLPVLSKPRRALAIAVENVRLACLPTTSRWRRLVRALYLLRVCEVRRPVLLHAHWTVPSDLAHLVSRVTGIPYSFSVHAHDLFDEAPLLERDRPGRALPHKVASARFVAVCTEHGRQHLEDMVPPTVRPRIRTVYHGTDCRFFEPPENPSPRERPVILSVGRLVSYKGFDRLVRVCGALATEGAAFECWIVGGGPERPRLQTLIREHGLEDRVRLLGSRTDREICELYRAADLFVLAARPERGQHGLPNVLVEAMSCGLATVTTDLAAVRELIADGSNGFIVPDDRALLSTVRSLLESRGVREAVGRAARETVERKFCREDTIRSLVGLLRGAARARTAAT